MWKEVVGQKEYIESIKSAIDNNRLPHALLISGNEGTGGLPLAFATAQYLMCPDRNADDACGECPECIQMQKLMHPDLHFIYPIIKKDDTTISTDYLNEWRDLFVKNQYITRFEWQDSFSGENKQTMILVAEASNIVKELSTKPYESDYRVMIIWQPERMNVLAANKLLKIIEEPYEKTHFIFVSEDPESLLPTILSRVQRINLPPIKDEDLTEALISRFGCSRENAIDYARMSHGSFVEALKLIHDDEERQFFFEKFKIMMRSSYAKKIFEMKSWSDEMSTLSREKLKAYLQYSQNLIRENFIMNINVPDLNYMNNEEREFSQKFHAFVNEKNVEGIMTELEQAEKDIVQNVSEKMVFFDLSLKLIMLLKQGAK